MDSEVERLRPLSAESRIAGTKVAFHSMSLLSTLEDDVGHGHFTWSQRNHEHFLDAVSWTDTRSRSHCLRRAPASCPPRGSHLDITTNPLSSAEWRRGSGRGGAPQEPLASTDQKPLSPALSPRFAAGRGSQLRW